MSWLRPSASVRINRPQRRVFEYYVTPRAWAPEPRFDDHDRPLERPLGVGDSFTATYHQWKQQVRSEFEVIELERPRRVVVTAAIDPLVQETTIELAPTDGNETILTFSVKLRTRRRWLRVPVPPLPLFFMLRLTIGRTVRGERKRIESLVR